MAKYLSRLFSSTLFKSEVCNSSTARLIFTTTRLMQSQQQEKKELSDSDIKEKTRNEIENEQKFDSKDEDDDEDGYKNKETGEIGGPRGPEPTRYGDWEKNVLGSTEFCSSFTCSRGEAVIRFPFRLKKFQPKQCGYPGFDLFCDGINQTILELPNSGEFTIQAIDYKTQKLWINDPENCLPRRLLTLNLSGSPFTGDFYQGFTLFNCSFGYRSYQLDPIACLSGDNYTVFASSDERVIRSLASKCNLIATVAVPVQWTFYELVKSSNLANDLLLKWVSPRCRRCESRGGQCRLKSISTTETECRKFNRRRLPEGARYAIVAGAGVPAILCLVGLLCYICGRVKRYGHQHHQVEFTSTMVPQPTAVSGLDIRTIESYPKTVLGESRRLPKPDDNICSICLSEYKPKETLRSIPECQHCFHAECIDEWLRMKASCPVCRNSPDSSSWS